MDTHFTQVLPSLDGCDPAVHFIHSLPLLTYPALQLTHAVLPGFGSVPTSHFVQAAPLTDTAAGPTTSHDSHSVLLDSGCLPAAQALHSTPLVLYWLSPLSLAMHFTHLLLSALGSVDAGHAIHLLPSLLWPALQSLQSSRSAEGSLPTEHVTHCVPSREICLLPITRHSVQLVAIAFNVGWLPTAHAKHC